MWQTKTFPFKDTGKSKELAYKQFNEFLETNKDKYIMVEIFVNNAYGFEYKTK